MAEPPNNHHHGMRLLLPHGLNPNPNPNPDPNAQIRALAQRLLQYAPAAAAAAAPAPPGANQLNFGEPLILGGPVNDLVPLLANAPYIGEISIPEGTVNAISYEKFQPGEQIVIIKKVEEKINSGIPYSEIAYTNFYHLEPLNEYYRIIPTLFVKNPLTNETIGKKNDTTPYQKFVIQRATVKDMKNGGRRRKRKSKRHTRKTTRTRKMKRFSRRR